MHVDNKINRLSFFGAYALTVLVLSVTRGAIPLFFGSASLTRPTYTFSFLLGLLLSLVGVHLALFKKNSAISKQLRQLLIVNLVLNVIWWIPVIIFNPERNLVVSLAYTGIFPFSIFGFTRIPERHLKYALAILTLIVAGSVMWDFIELNTGLVPGGYDLAVARQTLLRPDTFAAFGRTGVLFRAVGILGGDRPHDTGNLLAMLSIYWVAHLFRKDSSKVAVCTISALGISTMLMTQSASNIMAFFVGFLFIVFAYRRKIFSLTGISTAAAAGVAGAGLLYIFARYLDIKSGMLWQWSERVGPGGAWRDMTALGITDVGMDFLTIFIGHGSSLGFSRVGDVTELGFLKMLMESGLISFLIFLTLLIYPAWRYLSTKRQNMQFALPYIAPVIVGFVSLWHYGSVLRTTNIFVYFALYAHALKISVGERSSPAPNLDRRSRAST